MMPPLDLLIVDESQYLKEPTIKRTNMIYGGSNNVAQTQVAYRARTICIVFLLSHEKELSALRM
jgi:hypothetical protein